MVLIDNPFTTASLLTTFTKSCPLTYCNIMHCFLEVVGIGSSGLFSDFLSFSRHEYVRDACEGHQPMMHFIAVILNIETASVV
jgi:hypothetical protein